MQAPKTVCAGSNPVPDSKLCRGSSVVEHLLEDNRLQGSSTLALRRTIRMDCKNHTWGCQPDMLVAPLILRTNEKA